MTEREYRQDDQAIGYCPLCGRQLSGLTGLLRGYCEQHGWTFADFTKSLTLEDCICIHGNVVTPGCPYCERNWHD